MPIVHDMAMERYQALKALSAGGAWLLAQECPAVYWQASPWNEAREPDNRVEFDLGQAAHLAILESAKLSERIVLIDAPDYRTKAAQLLRAEAYKVGRVPLLPNHLDLIQRIAAAVRADPWAGDLLDGAEVEVSFFWAEGGVPCKARADIVSRDGLVLGDIKTASSANPRAFQRAAFAHGYFLRPAWYLDGWAAASQSRPNPRDYWFVVVGKDEPHVVTVCRLDQRALEWGRMMCRHAVWEFRQCMNTGEWPGYCREPATLSLPTFGEYQLADREQAGEFSIDDLRRASEFLEP